MPLFTLTDNKSISYSYRRKEGGVPENYPEEVKGSYWIDNSTNQMIEKLSIPEGNYSIYMTYLENETTSEEIENYYLFYISASVAKEINSKEFTIGGRCAFLGKININIPLTVNLIYDKDSEKFNNNRLPLYSFYLYFLAENNTTDSEGTFICGSEIPTSEEIDLLELNKFYQVEVISIDTEAGAQNINPSFEDGTPEETIYNILSILIWDETLEKESFGNNPFLPIDSLDRGLFTFKFPSVKITCSTENSQIYYTLDNSNPTPFSSLYSTPFIIEENNIIKAIATKEGWDDSNIAILNTSTSTISTEYIPEVTRQSENNKTLTEDSNKTIL